MKDFDTFSDGTPIPDKRRELAEFFGEEYHEEDPPRHPVHTSTGSFVVPHPNQYHEGGIVGSVPVFMKNRPEWRKRQDITERYERMNAAYQQARAEVGKTFAYLTRIAPALYDMDKKRLVSRLRTGRDIIIPVPVTVLDVYAQASSSQGDAGVKTREYGLLQIRDVDALPFKLKTGYLLRFRGADGKAWFRLGWKKSDEERHLARRTKVNGSEGEVRAG